jgi:uncharacterized protein (TIGR03067 family)
MAIGGEALGQKSPPPGDGSAGLRITFTPDKAIWEFYKPGEVRTYEGFCHIDSSKSPKQIDLGEPDNPNPKKLAPAIYKIEGDRLTICWGPERPKTFSEPAKIRLEFTRVSY